MIRKNLLNMLLLAALTFMAACQSNEPEKKIKYIAHATIEQGDEAAAGGPARIAATHLDGNDQQGYKVCWSAGDQFKVMDNYNTCCFDLIAGDSTTSGTFATESSIGLTGDGGYLAYYPASLTFGGDGMIWPTQQTYTPGGCAEAPMTATIESYTQRTENDYVVVEFSPLHFTNEGGLLRLSTSGTNVFYAKAIAFHSDQINVTLDCGGICLSADRYAYIALPAGTYSGVSLTFTGYDGTEITKALKEGKQIVIERSKISPIAVPVSNSIPVPETIGRQTITFNGNSVEVANVDFAGGQTFSWYALMGNGDLVAAVWGNDWRMPTEAELRIMTQLGATPALNLMGGYWSSTSVDDSNAKQYYNNGTDGSGVNGQSKSKYAKVRPVYVGHANNQISE